MTDIIVRIMVEVLSILGIVMKEVGRRRTSMSFPIDISPNTDFHPDRYLRRLVGRKDVEEALWQLDKLTQEEARMAAAEALTITCGIDNRVEDVYEGVQSVDMKVDDIDYKVRSVKRKVQGVDHKVGSVIQGELYLH